MRPVFISLAAILLSACNFAGQPAHEARPQGYPQSYDRIIADAEKEGEVTIYSATETSKIQPLLDDFHKLYPRLRINYVTIHTLDLNNKIIAEGDGHKGVADIAWSSAMAQQIKLVNDGYAQAYASPELRALPEWALWKNEAYGITAEPIVFAYNRKLMPKADIPMTHAAFTKLLEDKASTYRNSVATYDPMLSGVGYLLFMQDIQATPDTEHLIRAMAATKVQLYDSTQSMVPALATGKKILAYNVISSYVLERAQKDQSIGIIVPQDYTLLMSRIAFIPAEAPHPNAARLFLDYLLSRRGQSSLAGLYMNPVRTDMAQGTLLASARGETRGIRLGPALLVDLDTLKARHFVKQWNAALAKAN